MDAPSPTTARRVIRTRSDRVIAGVAGGFGRYLNVDPVFIRLALVLLTLVAGVGALLYLVAWVIIPDEPIPDDPSPRIGRRLAPTWLLVLALLAVSAFGGFGRMGFGVRSNVVWPLTLILIGITVLWARKNPREEPEAPSVGDRPLSSPGLESTAGTHASAEFQDVGQDPEVVPSPLRRALPLLGRVAIVVLGVVGALVVAVIAVVALEGPGRVELTALEVFVMSAVAIAFAVWAGHRWRRTPDLLAIACIAIVVFGMAAWLRPPFRGGFGTRDLRPTEMSAIDHSYQLAIGRMHIDLGQVDLNGRRRTVAASLGIGRLEIVVPDDADVTISGHVRGGEICAFGLREGGTDLNRDLTSHGTGGALRVDAKLGLGSLLIARNSQRGAMDCATHDHRSTSPDAVALVAPPSPCLGSDPVPKGPLRRACQDVQPFRGALVR
jgi:phage shock protein PspC (stress-responsive transcriptional regulator)